MRALFFFAALILSLPVPAKHFRWASQGDAASLDPHAQNEGLNNNLNDEIFERLTAHGPRLGV